MIDLKGVSKAYSKGQPALNNVSLHVEKGVNLFLSWATAAQVNPL